MLHSRLQELARTRMQITGEKYETALQELRRQGTEPVLIPRATVGQAGFEANLLDLAGQTDISLWPTGAPAWGLLRLTPRSDEVLADADERCLIDLIKQLMPTDGQDGQIYGCPGLRFAHVRRGVELFRPGQPGKLVLRVSESTWRKASTIARLELIEDCGGHPPTLFWEERPHDWDLTELQYVNRWSERHGSDGAFHRNATALSVVFRHLAAWNVGENLDYTKLWTNGAMHDGYAYPIHFMWANGPKHEEIITLLTDPIFRIEEQRERLMAQCHCHTGQYCSVIVRLASGNELFLRRDTEAVRIAKDKLPDGRYYRDDIERRVALCAAHGLLGPLGDAPTSHRDSGYQRRIAEERVIVRCSLTGETETVAKQYLAVIPDSDPVIVAASDPQAALETRYALAWGRPMYQAWRPDPSPSIPSHVGTHDDQYPPMGII